MLKEKLFDIDDEDVTEIVMGFLAEGHTLQDASIAFNGLQASDWEDEDCPFSDEWIYQYNRRIMYTRAVRAICRDKHLKTASEYAAEYHDNKISEDKYVTSILSLVKEKYPFDLVFMEDEEGLHDSEEFETELVFLEEVSDIVLRNNYGVYDATKAKNIKKIF